MTLTTNLMAEYWQQNFADPWKGWDVVYDVYVDSTTELQTAVRTRDLSNPSTLTVSWGDNTEQLIPRDSQTIYHTYPAQGLYTVKFRGCNESLVVFDLFSTQTVNTKPTVRMLRKISNCASNTYYMPSISGCTNADIPNGILDPRMTTITGFAGCSSLSLSLIPSTITKINALGFRWCTSLRVKDIPSSVTFIGNYAFQLCTSLTEMTFHGPCELALSPFAQCTNLTDLYVPWSEGDVANAPWGLPTGATIHYNHTV